MLRTLARSGPRFTFYAVALGLATFATVVLAAFGGGWSEASTAHSFWIFALFLLVGELLPIRLPREGIHDEVTMSASFALALLLCFGLGPALAAYAVASLVTDLRDRTEPLKMALNAGNYSVSLGAAALVLGATTTGRPAESLVAALPWILAAAVAFFAVNQVLAGVGAALLGGRPILAYMGRNASLHVWTDGFLVALAPIVVAAADESLWLVPLFVFPMVASYLGGREAVRGEHRALHDNLTDLPNRSYLTRRLDDVLAAADRAGEKAVVMLVDLDDFKAVNDTLGHRHGDILLREVGPRMRAALREQDVIGRLGGDEFAVLLPRANGRLGEQVAERLLRVFDAPFDVGGLKLDVRASVGLSVFPEDGKTADDLVQHADVALYRAKERRSAWERYSPDHDEYTLDRLVLAGQLRRGIDRGELVVHYQPKLALVDGRPCGVEALVRWNHPQLGLVGPAGFIPLAEHTGIIGPLTEFVIRSAVGQCAAWRASGLDLQVSVNLSARTLLATELTGWILTTLEDAGLPPTLLQVEITESKIIADLGRARSNLRDLHAAGVGGAIDDFGTGYSSLAQLQQLPVDEMKIDRSFVSAMDTNPNDAAIVRSTIELGRNLGMRVTAEGVENEAVRTQLEQLGCDFAQGYHLCPPMPAERCERLLTSGGMLAPRSVPLRRPALKALPAGLGAWDAGV